MVVTMPESRHIAGGVSRALLLHGVTFEDVWEALAVLEPPLTAAAARRRTRGDLRNLRAAIETFATASRLTEDAVHNCAEFFRRLGECTHNPALVLAQEPLLQLLGPSLGAMVDLVPQARARIAAAQQRIGAAVEARDTDDAASWMSKHIRDFKKGYEVARISPQMRVA
jgi:DNA-binding FadR family transcriptional regulator